MMKVAVNRYFADAFFSAALAVLLFLPGLSSLAAGPLAAYFAPAPLIWAACRHGGRTGAVAVLLSVSFILPFAPLTSALSFAVGSSFMGWLVGVLLLRRGGLVMACLASAAAAIALSFALSALHLFLAGLEPGTFLSYQVNELFHKMETAMEEMTKESPQATFSLQSLLAFFRLTFPAFLLVTVFLQGTANGLVTLLVLSRHHPTRRWSLPDLTSFSLPDTLIWILISSLALLWLPPSHLRTVSLNIVVLLLFFYLLQGLSVGMHFLKRWNTGRPLRMILVIVMLLQPYLLALPLLAGLLDFRFSWRKHRPPADEGSPGDSPPQP